MNNVSTDIYSHLLTRLRNWVLLLQSIFFVTAKSLDMIDSTQLLLGGSFLIFAFVANQVIFIIRRVRISLLQNLILDASILIYVLFISGGYQNPLVIIFLAHFLAAPIFLATKELFIYLGFCFLGLGILSNSNFILSYPSFTFLTAFEVSVFMAALATVTFSYWFVKKMKDLEHSNSIFKSFATRVERYRSLGLLASGVCHEIGTPLNTISMRVERLHKKINEDEDLLVLERNVNKCVDALKKLNLQVHNEDEKFYREKLELNTFLREFSRSHEGFVFFKDVDKEIFVNVPQLLLVNSLNDVVNNSKEAQATFLKMIIAEELGMIKLIIEDNGSGFLKEILGDFGIPFLTSKPNGTGLGLYHLNNLMLMIGGSLTISNNKEGGAKHVLKLPRYTKNESYNNR